MNTEFKVKLTPKDDKAVYSQSLPMPIHLEKDVTVELALMQKNEIITVLLFFKVVKSHFCTVETQWKNTSSCGSQGNQHTHSG